MSRPGKWMKIFIDDSGGTARDLTSQCMDVGDAPLEYDQIDVSAYEENKNYINGQGDSTLTFEFEFSPTATTGSHTVLSGIVGGNTSRTVTLQYGNGAAATGGDPELEGEMILPSYVVTAAKGEVQKIKATFKPGPGAALPAWGTV
uniref:Uncharacterized protein n=1 Tax=viral metagenome TaxID=1070528 RepID=A0A6M3LCD3_9ZZZZ